MSKKQYDFTKIDFSELRIQKRELLRVIAERNLPDSEDDLDGIVHLIDTIQDYVCDELGYNENEVFDLESDDPDFHPEPLYVATDEPDEQKFAREMSQLIYENHIESSYLYEHEEMSEEFVENVLNMPENAQACKELIRLDILKDFENDPDQFTRDENNKLRYEDNMHEYGYVIETYCLEKFYEGKTKEVWLCPHCGSDNIKVKVWAKPNSGMLTDVEDAYPIKDECLCLDCHEEGLAIFATLKYTAKVIGFQVVGIDGQDSYGEIHPDMDGSFCLYSLAQANEMLKHDKGKSDAQWRLLTIWTGDVEEPTMMFTGDPRA